VPGGDHRGAPWRLPPETFLEGQGETGVLTLRDYQRVGTVVVVEAELGMEIAV
jgi:hypothetical protein